ncbi:uncharacterized protein Dwil_GK13472 [Drosophila willistoni]|uniref:snRNA-activating protein complex subunit 4 n=1 Tax=Drosophila willistoni TaxID=7260 RepID=B4NJ41_DROWI|nr:snRNA-activating protein complex subunit 4 [Drosophila willistoni]EDW83834.1 uncharacterized protein Dwil_GK13472 [Drosophila willistoni]
MCNVDALKWNQNQLLLEITSLLQTTSQPSDANALVLNQEMQRRLEQVKAKIHILLKSVRARYARNEEILVRRLKPRSRQDEAICQSGAILRGGTFRFKGNLYFRDVDGRSCPNNEDYERRCADEMFPTDFDMRSKHVWTILDKKNVVMGVKQQLLDYTIYKNQLKIQNVLKRKAVDQHTKSLVSLMAAVDGNFSIDWNQISTIDVAYRHSSYSCEAMWQVYLDPKIRRDDWTEEEDEALAEAAKSYQMQNWQAIASSLDGRSDYQCFVRVQTTLRSSVIAASSSSSSPNLSSGGVKWSEEENEKLISMVEKNTMNGQVNWQRVVEHFPGKSKSTIIGRYTYVLHPSISHDPFSSREDMMLFAAVEEYGGKFHCFPRSLFPNRSLAQLRTRYHNVLAQRDKTDAWSELDDTKLMQFVTEHGATQWVNCAAFLGNHTRTSCRTRYLVIKRFLERNPSATVQDFPRRKKTKNSQVTSENWAQRLQEWHDNPDSLAAAETKPPKPKRTRRKKPKVDDPINNSYMRSLKGMDLQIYNYFKYSYNLKLNEPNRPISLPRDATNLERVVKSLAYKQPAANLFKPIQSPTLPKSLSQCYNTMFFKLDTNHNEASPSESSLLLPPSWSTMMGFRAMCILSGHCRSQSSVDTSTFVYDESSPAVQLFRQRLRSLFYRTTLLSRLEVEIFKDLPGALVASPRPPVNTVSPVIEELPKEKKTQQKQQERPNARKILSQDDVKKRASNQMKQIERLIEKQKKCKTEPMSEDEISLKQEFLSEDDGEAEIT